jgi:hypothetical protein
MHADIDISIVQTIAEKRSGDWARNNGDGHSAGDSTGEVNCRIVGMHDSRRQSAASDSC